MEATPLANTVVEIHIKKLQKLYFMWELSLMVGSIRNLWLTQILETTNFEVIFLTPWVVYLHLLNNNFFENILSMLRNYTFLGLLCLGNNKFLRNTLSWIGELTSIVDFHWDLTNLSTLFLHKYINSLIVLDLADNTLRTIPKCLNN